MSEGELYVTGRLKDTIIVRGRNFDPTPIEVAAGRADGVRTGNVAAFSISGDLTERIVVAAEYREGDPGTIEANVVRAVQQGLGPRAASSSGRRRENSTSTAGWASCVGARMRRPLLE
jgi:acyl-CoA synthetase (AMP-forming)/AMP-acid ligase II